MEVKEKMRKKIEILNKTEELSYINRNNILIKIHYFFLYSTFASILPILNILLRNRSLTDIEILYINIIIPFIVFITNPLFGLIIDRLRYFRLIFNIILLISTILLIIVFNLPSLKSYVIQGYIYKSDINEYSLSFCATKQFAYKCSLRSQCGCTYQAHCRSLIEIKNNLNYNEPIKKFRFNFTIDSTFINYDYNNVTLINNKTLKCLVNYHLPMDQNINIYKINQPIGKIFLFHS